MPQSTRTRIGSYRDLDVWQFAMDIVVEIYRVTRAFPAAERFGLIAADFRHFVSIARRSVAEVANARESGEG